MDKRGMLKMELEEHIGERWGRLVIIATEVNPQRNVKECVCKCDCGNVTRVPYGNLKRTTKSCGCLKRERCRRMKEEARQRHEEKKIRQKTTADNRKRKRAEREKNQKHNTFIQKNKRLHSIWQGMKSRCNDKSNPFYGGRGITVCIEWRTFDAFAAWALSHGYTDELTIDRINPDGDYTPDNCRWATMKEQNNNRRANRFYELNGETLTMSQWAEKLGMSHSEFEGVLRHGGFKPVANPNFK